MYIKLSDACILDYDKVSDWQPPPSMPNQKLHYIYRN